MTASCRKAPPRFMPSRCRTRRSASSRIAAISSSSRNPPSWPSSSSRSWEAEEFAMHIMYFTEQPMSSYPEQEGRNFRSTALMFPNKHFDAKAARRLYNQYIEQYVLAEEMGFDGIMLNEHHNAPFCMQAKTNIMASVLA